MLYVIQLYMQIIWMFIWMVVIQRHEHWTFQKQLVIARFDACTCCQARNQHGQCGQWSSLMGIWSNVRPTNGNRT